MQKTAEQLSRLFLAGLSGLAHRGTSKLPVTANKFIADAPDRLDSGAGIHQTVAQCGDVDIDRARIDHVLVAPDLIEQPVPRDDDTRPTRERDEQRELLRAHLNELVPDLDLAAIEVDRHIPYG